jgi:hypothetical protein
MTTDRGIAIGGGALAFALIDFMVEMNDLPREDVVNHIIERAKNRLTVLSPEDRAAAQEVFSALAERVNARP